MSESPTQREMEEAFYRAMQRQKPGIAYQVARAVVMAFCGIAVFFLIILMMANR